MKRSGVERLGPRVTRKRNWMLLNARQVTDFKLTYVEVLLLYGSTRLSLMSTKFLGSSALVNNFLGFSWVTEVA